jgi:uncharacterized membrane protein
MKKSVVFITAILLMLITGVFWGTWFTLTRRLDNFSAVEFIHIGQTIITNVAVQMSIIMPAALLFLLLSMWSSCKTNRAVFWLFTLSFVLMVATLIITVGVEVPIDNQIKNWTPETVPENWTSLRRTWNEFHTIRTFTSIGSFVFYVGGILRSA